MSPIVAQVAKQVEAHLKHEGTGHDWEHIRRVWQNALKLAETEKANIQTLSLAALLHDVDDAKVTKDVTSEEKLPKAREFMANAKVSSDEIETVCTMIKSMGYRKVLGGIRPTLIEAQILSDADFLEAIGSIGIARVFTYSGHMDRQVFLPDWLPGASISQEEYLHGKSHAVNHFFDKLLKLRELMFTKAGKAEAEIRHQRLITYLENLFEETNAPAEWSKLLKSYRS